MKRLKDLVLLALAAALLAPVAVRADPAVTRQQDGIVAELSLNGSEAVLDWRFLWPPPAPVSGVEASANARPLGTPAGYEPYPAAGQRSSVLFLLDMSGLDRAEQIRRDKAAVFALAARMPSYHTAHVALYDSAYHALTATDADALAKRVAEAAPQDAPGHLSDALAAAIGTLAALPADRRSVFVFTDGHNAGTMPLAEVEELAKAKRVSVNFVVRPSRRLADIAALTRLAMATGGRLTDADAGPLRDPFALMDSGARVRFPLGAVHRYFWEGEPVLRVALLYGDRRLELSTGIPAPTAGPAETVARLWRTYPAGLLLGGGTAVAALAGLGLAVLHGRGRRRPGRHVRA